MSTGRRRAGRGIHVVHAGCACWLVGVCWAGQAMLWPSAAAQAPSPSRQELMRKWDIDRDGKVDASEAEIARGRMRRSRAETMMQSGTDPVTGKPRAATDPVTGRPMPPDGAAADRGGSSALSADEGLILVPGTGERPGAMGGTAAGNDMPPRPSQRDRESLPGTREPAISSAIPSMTPRLPTGAPVPDAGSRSPRAASASGRQVPPGPRDAGGADLSSRARVLPGTSAGTPPGTSPGTTPGIARGQNPNARTPQSLNAGQDRQQPGARPGIIAGGVRAGTPGARPGYGAGGVTSDLNAGRQAAQVPSVPRPAIGPYRGPTPPGGPAAGVPSVSRPGVGIGMGQPNGGPSVSRSPSTAPRVPRMTTDEFYGR